MTRWRAKASLLAFGGALAAAAPAVAEEPLGGAFVAVKACPAFQSKNTRSNPGAVMTEPLRAYAMVAINAPGGEFYRIRVPEAPVSADRWVSVICGVHTAGGAATPPARAAPPPGPRESTVNVLALSWQPAFCETRPGAAECRGRRGPAEALGLHGLWPEPEDRVYCGVPDDLVAVDAASRWDDLPTVPLASDNRARLARVMPGTASLLDRHEWLKHGTCFFDPAGADGYFADAVRLAEAVNGSAVGDYLERNAGQTVRTADLRAQFDAAFGRGAGARVEVSCVRDGGRTLIDELTLGLEGTIGPGASLGDLMRAAAPVRPGCPGGLIDPAGLQ